MKLMVTGTRGVPNVLGGVETHCENIYPLIAKHGVDVTLFARSPYVDYVDSEYKGILLKSLWAPKKKALEAILHTLSAALTSKIMGADVIHVHAIGPGLVIPFIKLLGLKVVFTHHGPDYDRQKWGAIASFILRLGERSAIKYSDKVIVISSVINEIIKEKYNRHDANVIYNGVPPFSGIENDASFLKKFDIEKHKYIVAVGRFVEEKGFHDLLNAFKNIDTDLKLVIVGDADHSTVYSRKLYATGNKIPNIVFTGFISGDELVSVFSNARLYVMPSYHEGLPISLLEAMSYMLPVIVSDIPANKEVKLPSGDYFRVGDVDNLRELITRKLGENFDNIDYSTWLKVYDWKVIADQTMNVYENLMQK